MIQYIKSDYKEDQPNYDYALKKKPGFDEKPNFNFTRSQDQAYSVDKEPSFDFTKSYIEESKYESDTKSNDNSSNEVNDI